jgi:serine/threonine protein phosphatase 1
MGRIFAIGDIHGCNKTFQKLLLNEICIQKSDKIYCIGDYIDRGGDSKGVIDFILKLRKEGCHIHTLRGNHEQLMIDSTKSEKNFNHWIKTGGDATLRSFKISSYDEMNPVYKNFFSRTKYYINSGKNIFVHAGLNFQNPNPFDDKYAMLWIRDFPLTNKIIDDKIIVHGHTPKSLDYILKQKDKDAINIDGGCVYKDTIGFGNLVALNITNGELIIVKNVE